MQLMFFMFLSKYKNATYSKFVAGDYVADITRMPKFKRIARGVVPAYG